MSDSRTLAQQLVAIRVLTDLVKEADRDTREEAQSHLVVGDRVTATIGDEPIGHVQLKKPRGAGRTVVVTDEAALLAWVEQARPGEVVTTRRVRASYLKHLLDTVRAAGVYVDVATGEAFDLPGVSVTDTPEGSPTLEVRPVAGAAERVREAWRDGTLRLSSLPALGGAE